MSAYAPLVLAFLAGLLVATVTTPVGVSGAVFLLPIQLDVLLVPSPAVTPTNLLYNVVATPGGLLRHRRTGALGGELVGRILAGTLPGVVLGTVARVFLAPGEQVFRLLAGVVLLPIGLWLCLRRDRAPRPTSSVSPAAVTALGLVVGVIGGLYGIGGGSLIGPALVGAGLSVARVAPAALTATFLTSVAGVAAYGALVLIDDTIVRPDWALGILCGLGGLAGSYVGARLQPRLPEKALRVALGLLAVALGATYLVQGLGAAA